MSEHITDAEMSSKIDAKKRMKRGVACGMGSVSGVLSGSARSEVGKSEAEPPP